MSKSSGYTPGFRNRAYSLFDMEKTDVLRRQDAWYERLQFPRPRPSLQDRLLRELPCDRLLRECTSVSALLTTSGITNDAAVYFEATATWWLLRARAKRPPRWKDAFWRALCVIVEPETAQENFGEAKRDAASGSTFDIGPTRPKCGIVTTKGTFNIAPDAEPTAIAAIEGAFGKVPVGCRRLYHGTTAATATSFLAQGAQVRHVDQEPHDFGKAFYTTPQIAVAFRLAADTSDHGFASSKPGTLLKAHNDPTVLVFDVDEAKLSVLEWDFEKGDDEDWCTFVHNCLHGCDGDLPPHLTRIRSSDCPTGNVVSGSMCCNGCEVTDDTDRSTMPISSDELHTAFRPGRGIKLISPDHVSTGVVAVYMIREKHIEPYPL
jgi:hypothetical protein